MSSDRGARDKCRFEMVLNLQFALSVYVAEHTTGRHSAHQVHRVIHCRQGRMHVACKEHVVESDNGKVVGDRPAALPRLLDGANRHLVVGADSELAGASNPSFVVLLTSLWYYGNESNFMGSVDIFTHKSTAELERRDHGT